MFDAIVTARAIPWRPKVIDDEEVFFLRWRALVQENRVPDTFVGLIDALEQILLANPQDPMPALRRYALSHKLDPSACTQ